MAPHCAVLRCPNLATTVIRSPGELLLEWAVCADHKAAIDAGEPWRADPDPESHTVLMGTDIRQAGEVLLTDYTGWSNDLATVSAGVEVVRFHFTDETGEAITFLMPAAVVRNLADDVVRFGIGSPPDAGAPEPSS